MSGTPLVRPGAQSQLDYGAVLPSQPTTTRTTPDSGLGADDQMRHQERRVPPPGFAHPPPHPQFIPQDGTAGGPHHQPGNGVYGQCDGNFDKEKVPYDGPSPFHRSSRYESDSSAISGDPMVYSRAQPMMSQSLPSGGRYEDTNATRMVPPSVNAPGHGNPTSGMGYSQIPGYYGMGGAGGLGAVPMQRPPIAAVPSGYEGDAIHAQSQPPSHQMQQGFPQYYTPNQPPPSSIPYQIQPPNGTPMYSGQPMQQQDPQMQHQGPPPMGPPPQAVVTVQQRGGGQFIVPVPHPQMMAPQYVGQQVVSAGAQYPPAGVYMQRPTVFVPRGEMGYTPMESAQPMMVPMPFVVQQMPPNQAPDQTQYQQGVMEQQQQMAMDQYGEQEYGPSGGSVQPVRPMSMPPGISAGMQPMMGMMQPPQASMHDTRSATASIPPLATQPSNYGPSPQMYRFHPGTLAPPFMMAPHFGMPPMMHSSPGRGRNARNNSSFRGPTTYHNRNRQGHSPLTFSRQSSVIDTSKDDTKGTDMASTITAEIEELTINAEGASNTEVEAVEHQEELRSDEKAEERREEEEQKSQEEQPSVEPSADVKPEKKPEEAKPTKELLPLAVAKTDAEKRATVPIVAVAPTVSVKAEVMQAKEKELNEEDIPEKPSMEFRIRESSQPSVQPLPSSDSSTPVKLDCTFCRSIGKPEEVCSSHVIRAADGKVTCPELRKRTCNLCGATGDNSHSAVFCPLKAQQSMGEPVGDAPRISHTGPPRQNPTYNKPMIFERRDGVGYRGGYRNPGHRGGGYHQGRGAGRYQTGNRRYN